MGCKRGTVGIVLKATKIADDGLEQRQLGEHDLKLLVLFYTHCKNAPQGSVPYGGAGDTGTSTHRAAHLLPGQLLTIRTYGTGQGKQV